MSTVRTSQISSETKRIGQRIKDFRQAKGWSFTDLADASGIDRSRLCTMEHGKHSPNVDTLAAVAKALGVTYADIAGYVDPLLIYTRNTRRSSRTTARAS